MNGEPTDSEALLPCPFCGSSDIALMSRYGGSKFFCVKCNDCWAKSAYVLAHDKAATIAAWNTRATISAESAR